MSLRQVLTIYNAERRLDDDDIAWLDRLRNMTDAERALLIEQLSDKPQKKAGKKSAGGSGADRCIYTFPDSGAKCNLRADKAIHTEKKHPDYHTFYTGKSARASGMAAQLNKSLQQQHRATTDDDDNTSDLGRTILEDVAGESEEPARCQLTRADGNPCKLLPDHNIHHMTTANEYHEYESASSTTGKSDAQSAAGGS